MSKFEPVILDKTKITLALQKLSAALAETPKWIILLKRDGELLTRIGEFANIMSPPLEDQLVASLTYTHALHEIEMLGRIEHGTFQYSISIGGGGAYFIAHLNDTYVLGISYQRIGVRSIDIIVEGVIDNFQELLEALL